MAPAEQDQDIIVQITNNFDGIDDCSSGVEILVRAVCNRFSLPKATVSIAIVDDVQIRKLNSQFLKHKTTTDCLSFDLSNGDEPQLPKSFELIVNGQMALRQANLRGHSSQAELALYITHGLLHNLGFDDSTPSKAQKMHDTEDEILQHLGYGLVYNKGK